MKRPHTSSSDNNTGNAFSVLMRGARESATAEKDRANKAAKKKKSSRGPWAGKLRVYCERPDQYSNVVLFDEKFVVIRDIYPKATYHFLVLVRDSSVDSVIDLDPAGGSVDLVSSMVSMGERVVTELKLDGAEFRYGFHSIPSMDGLHLHVISQDFCSPSLKTKRHYNSFTTAFFLDASFVVETLREGRRVDVDDEECSAILRSSPLVCHACGVDAKNMPSLKAHLEEHRDSFLGF